MATTLGTLVTAFDATPMTTVNARLHGGLTRTISEVSELAIHAIGDVHIVARVPVDAVIKAVRHANDALTAGAADIGLYKKNADGTYTAVGSSCFATAVAMGSAVALTDVTYEAAATNIDKRNVPAWQRAGLSARPAYGDLYVAYTFTTATTAVGTILTEVEYTI